jgi:IS30 family transposase
MPQRGYKHLTDRDRLLIASLKKKKLSLSEIARRIGKNKSTVSRELRRNAFEVTPEDRLFHSPGVRSWTEEQLDEHLQTKPRAPRQSFTIWNHTDAHSLASIRAWRASQKRRRKAPETRKWVVEKLRNGWSPQQIAGRSKIDGPEGVSHEYVYALLHRDKKRGGKLYRLLKRFRKRKQRLGARAYRKRPAATNRASIEDRPAIVAKRARLGDCEADLIIGYRQSGCILSVIDRRSRATILRRLKTKHMDGVRLQLEFALRKLGGAHTLTVDNGKEFFAHEQLAKNARVRVFFTHPYCSTERASIENLNGLVRYYLPKRTSFANLTQRRLNEIETLLNRRPRRCLGYLTPHEVHFKKKKLRTRAGVAFDP